MGPTKFSLIVSKVTIRKRMRLLHQNLALPSPKVGLLTLHLIPVLYETLIKRVQQDFFNRAMKG